MTKPPSGNPEGGVTVKKNAVQFPILLRNIDKRTGAGAPKAPLCKGSWHEVTEGL